MKWLLSYIGTISISSTTGILRENFLWGYASVQVWSLLYEEREGSKDLNVLFKLYWLKMSAFKIRTYDELLEKEGKLNILINFCSLPKPYKMTVKKFLHINPEGWRKKGEDKMKTKYRKLKNRLVANTLVNPRRLNINIEQRTAMIQLELPEFHKD